LTVNRKEEKGEEIKRSSHHPFLLLVVSNRFISKKIFKETFPFPYPSKQLTQPHDLNKPNQRKSEGVGCEEPECK
jgi:hypothetical protein